ncbi:MAG: FAD-dependent oxidoreductase [Alphaproteobacteria bacterium]|nr:FAD-dependent oxidoreductase [Alphaproteobacteria bacterium]
MSRIESEIAVIDTEIAVIGGGIAGLSTALHVALRGVPVVVLESRQAGAAASGVNFGGVRRNGRALAELELAARAIEIWHRLPELVGNDCEYSVTGHLKVARNDDDMATMAAHAEAQAPYGCAVEMISRNALMARYPWFSDAAYGAAWCASDGQANPRLLGPAFARAARANGADIREHEPVAALEKDGDGFLLRCDSGLEVRARQVVNAAGAWGARVAGWLGEAVELWPMMPQMVVTEPAPYFIEPALGVVGGDVYVRQIPRGNIIFGGRSGTADLDEGFGHAMTEEALGALQRTALVIPRMAEMNIIRLWSGVEGCTPDQLPVLGPSATTPGVIHAFGFSGHGFCLGPGVGAVVAELALDGETRTAIDAFDIRRFQS